MTLVRFQTIIAPRVSPISDFNDGMMQPVSNNENFRAFMNLSKATNGAYHSAALKFGLSDSSFDILYFLGTEGSLTQKDLCLLTFSSKQTVNSSVQKMIKSGLIRIDEPHGQEKRGREKTLVLTEQGLKLAQETTLKVLEAEKRAFNSLDAKAQEQLVALSTQFTHALVDEIDALKPLSN